MAEIKKAGAPNKNTEGQLGDIYINTNTSDKYKLAYIHRTTTYDGMFVEYEWELIGGPISSGTIVRIEVVSELPEVEEDGVLYIVK
jgi:hypothetical protein